MYRLEVKFQGQWHRIKHHFFSGIYKLLIDDYVVAFVKVDAISDIRVIEVKHNEKI